MSRAALVGVLLLVLPGCALVKGWFTEPTGQVTFDRQELVEFWAITEHLGVLWFADEADKCSKRLSPVSRCNQVLRASLLARRLQVGVNAKLAHPEIRLDGEALKELVSILAGLRP